MSEIRIGEKMSELVDWDKTLRSGNGDYYPDDISVPLGRPMDTGRLLYCILRQGLPEEVDVEVYWDHFSDYITAVVTKDDLTNEVSFKDIQMARPDRLAHFYDTLTAIRGIVCPE